jgi:hypothetical protein
MGTPQRPWIDHVVGHHFGLRDRVAPVLQGEHLVLEQRVREAGDVTGHEDVVGDNPVQVDGPAPASQAIPCGPAASPESASHSTLRTAPNAATHTSAWTSSPRASRSWSVRRRLTSSLSSSHGLPPVLISYGRPSDEIRVLSYVQPVPALTGIGVVKCTLTVATDPPGRGIPDPRPASAARVSKLGQVKRHLLTGRPLSCDTGENWWRDPGQGSGR